MRRLVCAFCCLHVTKSGFLASRHIPGDRSSNGNILSVKIVIICLFISYNLFCCAREQFFWVSTKCVLVENKRYYFLIMQSYMEVYDGFRLLVLSHHLLHLPIYIEWTLPICLLLFCCEGHYAIKRWLTLTDHNFLL